MSKVTGWVEPFRSWARALKRDGLALWIAARDGRNPVMAKVVAAGVAAYAFSPFDLIPDFVPILGYLDDFILLPAGIALAIRIIPPPLMAEFRRRASARQDRPRALFAAGVIVAVWGAAARCSSSLVWMPSNAPWDEVTEAFGTTRRPSPTMSQPRRSGAAVGERGADELQ